MQIRVLTEMQRPQGRLRVVIGSYGNWNWAFAALMGRRAFEDYGKCETHVITNQSPNKSGMRDCHESKWKWRLTGDNHSPFRMASTLGPFYKGLNQVNRKQDTLRVSAAVSSA